MKDNRVHWHPFASLMAFLIGVILFWAFGRNWLDLGSASVFLAGVIGVAVAVVLFGAWKAHHDSHRKEN